LSETMAEYNPRQNQTDPIQGAVPTRKVTPEEVIYRDGYVHGRAVQAQEQPVPVQVIERRREVDRQERRLRTEADNYIASGLVLGLFIALLAGLIGGIMYFMTREAQNDAVLETQSENIVPVPQNRTVPQTQSQAQVSPDANIPDVNIVVPTPQAPPPNTVDNSNSQLDDTTTNGTGTTNRGTTSGTTTNGTTTNGGATGGTTNGTTTNSTSTDGTSTGTTTNGVTTNDGSTNSGSDGAAGSQQ